MLSIKLSRTLLSQHRLYWSKNDTKFFFRLRVRSYMTKRIKKTIAKGMLRCFYIINGFYIDLSESFDNWWLIELHLINSGFWPNILGIITHAIYGKDHFMRREIETRWDLTQARSDWTLKNSERFSSFPMFDSIWGEKDKFS